MKELAEVVRKVLHIPDVSVIETSNGNLGSDSADECRFRYVLPGRRWVLCSPKALDFGQRIQVYELIKAFSEQAARVQEMRQRNLQLLHLVDFARQLFDVDVSDASIFQRLFDFIEEFGEYAVFRNGRALARSGIRDQHVEAVLTHLEQRASVRFRSNYGVTTAFRESEFLFILVTAEEPDSLLLQMIRLGLEVIEAGERARIRQAQLKQIETLHAGQERENLSDESKESLASKYLALKQQFEKTLKLAMTDSLTDCLNRRKMEQVLLDQMTRSQESGAQFSLIMLDIDHFKKINDTHGHDAGDRVLVELTELLSSQLREQDQISRWGGEEFIIVLPDTSPEAALRLCERLRQAIYDHPFSIPQKVTASFGVSAFDQGQDYEALLKRLDNALYQAKAAGRNQTVLL